VYVCVCNILKQHCFKSSFLVVMICVLIRVGLARTVYIRTYGVYTIFWAGNYQIYGHLWCVYMVSANLLHVCMCVYMYLLSVCTCVYMSACVCVPMCMQCS
jgi:hypothetical protein